LLSAHQLHVKGRRDSLLPPTSLDVSRGELILAAGRRQNHRTALALVLSGRMKPSSGLLSWDSHQRIRQLRLASALVDSPDVNEPEQHLSVRDLVTEDLALVPRRYRGALLSGPWLKVNGFEDIAGFWTEQLQPRRRLGLLASLALANPSTDLLVVDSPDRHSGDEGDWLPQLRQLASDAGRPLAVVATVSALPQSWTGPAVDIGNAEAGHDSGEEAAPQEAVDPGDEAGPWQEAAAQGGADPRPDHHHAHLETEVAK
jgi:hypothetical protein